MVSYNLLHDPFPIPCTVTTTKSMLRHLVVATVCRNTCLLLHFIFVCRHKCFITVLSDYSSVSVQASHHIQLLVVVFVLKEREVESGAVIALCIVSEGFTFYTPFICILYGTCF